MAEAVVRLAGVKKDVGDGVRTRVLHGVDLELRRGEFAAVMGPSGSGKSTLLNLVGLLDRPTAGRVEIAGRETSVLDDEERARYRGRTVGFVFQFHHLLPGFTALENVMLPMAAETGRFDDRMRERALGLLADMGLADRAQLRATQLSGGQQQRVAIARALAMQPDVVLADEPTGNLDTQTADEVFAALRAINRSAGVTFLVVTHDPRIAARCDRTIELVDGCVVRDAVHHAASPQPAAQVEAERPCGGEELGGTGPAAAEEPVRGTVAERPRARVVGLAGAAACCWGVLGHVLLLGGTAWQLAPKAIRGLSGSTPGWVGGAALAACFGYVMGHRGLHRSFAPKVVARAIHLAWSPAVLHALLAPAYTAGLLDAPRRHRVGTACMLGSMAGFAMLVGRLPEPYRGAVDLAVAVALGWGAVAVVACAVRALAGRPPAASLELARRS